LAAEEEAAAEFEIAELFDDIGGAVAEDEFDNAAPAAPAADEESNQDG
jgi:large subunit ribosomal protein L9